MYLISDNVYIHELYKLREKDSNTPIPVRRALRKLGGDLRDARLRRRIPAELMSQRASISRTTLYKVERGDPGVSIATYSTVMFILGLIDRISELADMTQDKLGRQLDEERLPKRVRLHRRKSTKK